MRIFLHRSFFNLFLILSLAQLIIVSQHVIKSAQTSGSWNATTRQNPLVDAAQTTRSLKEDHLKSVGISDTEASSTKVSEKENANGLFELILKNEPAKKFKSVQVQLDRHSYNISLPESSPQNTSRIARHDELSVSESQQISSPLSRWDESSVGSDTLAEDELEESNPSFEGASSNLNEQKVMRELTKLLSKGMASAADQVKLEKLENWKQKQKERKQLKENRAKLFEDLLTAAINSHQDTTKKKGKKLSNKDGTSSGKTVPIFGDALGNMDPELANDAETVVQHLHGIASVIDNPPPLLPASSESLDESPANESPDSSTNESADENLDGGEKTFLKKPNLASGRPFMRGINKIKQQISHRRKQLDQIKKIFNVDLSINPKDGSLIGKSPSSSYRKRERDGYREVDDFTIIDDSSSNLKSGKKRSSGGKATKWNELTAYLMSNPEILASVMAELTVDADPSSRSIIANGDEGSTYNNYRANSRKSSSYKSPDFAKLLMESSKKSTSSTSPGSELDRARLVPEKTTRLNENEPDQGSYQSRSGQPASSIAENFLLESLRERQLMNLMRLEMVLAERQQASSNRSQTFASPNSANEGQSELNNQRSNRSLDKLQPQRQQQKRDPNREEVMHHFMVMNENSGGIGSKWSQYEQQQRYLRPGDDHKVQLKPLFSSEHSGRNEYSRQNDTLSRFKDWRDVSQAEASSSYRNDKTRMLGNATWLPYDLTTGSSSNTVESHGVHRDRQRGLEEFSIGQQPSTKSQFESETALADSSVTRPGLQPIKQRTHLVDMKKPSQSIKIRRNDTPIKKIAVDLQDEYQQNKDDYDSEKNEISTEVPFKPEHPLRERPIDYFSAYKSEFPTSYNQHEVQEEKVVKRRKKEVIDDGEDTGAMWAR